MSRYLYEGPIMVFDKCVEHRWKGETVATSIEKAKSNLSNQARKLCNLVPNASVSLPGKLYLLKGGVD